MTFSSSLTVFFISCFLYKYNNNYNVYAFISPRTNHIKQLNVIQSTYTTTNNNNVNQLWSTTKSTEQTEQQPIVYNYNINPLLKQIKPSKTIEIFSLVKTMENNGDNITSLCVGEPDFPPSQVVLDATIQSILNKDTKYTAVSGTIELRKAISNDLLQRKNLYYNPINEIVISNGAKQCVYQAILACVATNDQVLIPAPYWPSYPEQVLLANAIPIIVKTTSSNGYLLTPDQLRFTLQENPNITLMILCNPSNPTGGVYNIEQLKELCNVLEEYPKVRILADEIYERLIYDEDMVECPSIASISDTIFHRTLTINGFSKAYAMTGYRLGYVAGPKEYIKAITLIQGQLTSCASSISQAAGLAALTKVTDDELNNNIQIMKVKRDYIIKELNLIPGVNLPITPKGAFYVLPDISYYCIDPNQNEEEDVDICIELLQKYKLAVVPGSSFGAPGTIRISYATSMDELEIAMKKLNDFFAEKRSQMNK